MWGNFRLKTQNSMLDYIVKEKSTVDIETCCEKGYRNTDWKTPSFYPWYKTFVRKNVTRNTSKVMELLILIQIDWIYVLFPCTWISLNLILSLGLRFWHSFSYFLFCCFVNFSADCRAGRDEQNNSCQSPWIIQLQLLARSRQHSVELLVLVATVLLDHRSIPGFPVLRF